MPTKTRLQFTWKKRQMVALLIHGNDRHGGRTVKSNHSSNTIAWIWPLVSQLRASGTRTSSVVIADSLEWVPLAKYHLCYSQMASTKDKTQWEWIKTASYLWIQAQLSISKQALLPTHLQSQMPALKVYIRQLMKVLVRKQTNYICDKMLHNCG